MLAIATKGESLTNTRSVSQTDLEELDDVAGAEYPVRGGKLVRLRGREVRRQHAPVNAPATEDLARRARAQHRRRLPRRRRRRRGPVLQRPRKHTAHRCCVARGRVHCRWCV
jgi:hypothetical protein